ncbi:MAG: molybdopterin-binding protein [Candidatus Brocadiia bacterium]
MMRKVALENAVGLPLGHDITEVNPEEGTKLCAFRRGHVVTEQDLERLRRLGKHAVYIWEESGDELHEDEAARTVAPLAAGRNIRFDEEPTEGKIGFYADCAGLFIVDVERLHRINALEVPSLPTIHTNYPVTEGKLVAAFRIIPLTCDRSGIEEVRSILAEPLFRVAPYVLESAGIVVTGTEVYEGRVADGFTDRLTSKLEQFGVRVTETTILPDVRERISAAVEEFSETCDIVFVTGGTSVDPDDVTTQALSDAGVRCEVKGGPIQPGNNFTIGYRADVAVCAVPAAALHYKATALDVYLPRLLAGQRIPREEILRAGHGGLCHFCKVCTFPCCPFGVTG